VTDKVVLEQHGTLLIIRGHKRIANISKKMLKAKLVGGPKNDITGNGNGKPQIKPKSGGIRLDHHGIMPLDEKSFSLFKSIEVEFASIDGEYKAFLPYLPFLASSFVSTRRKKNL